MNRFRNRLMCGGLAALMIMGNTIPGFAAVRAAGTSNASVNQSTNNSSLTPPTDRKALSGTVVTDNGRYFYSDGWLWAGGNCYYFTEKDYYGYGYVSDPNLHWYSGAELMKGPCTTPDGYLIDSEGRWIDAAGNVQHNDYGNVKLGMAEQYAGKSNDEIWNLMSSRLKEIWKNSYPNTDSIALKEYSPNEFASNVDVNGFSEWSVSNTDQKIRIKISSLWYNKMFQSTASQDVAAYGNSSEITEKTIKTVLGDAVGQEFFNILRTQADINVSSLPQLTYNSDGTIKTMYVLHKTDGSAWIVDNDDVNNYNIIAPYPEGNGGINSVEWIGEMPDITTIVSGNGINPSLLNLSVWQNRTTDYGKTFNITYSDDIYGGLFIDIYCKFQSNGVSFPK